MFDNENRKEILIAAIVMALSLAWFAYECTKEPFVFPFEPFIGFLPSTIVLIYCLFLKKEPNGGKDPLELNVIPEVLTMHFIGRVKDIRTIHSMLFSNNRNVVIQGVGGLGKTSVAQEYVRRYRTFFDHIVYIAVILPPEQDNLDNQDFTDQILRAFARDTVLLKNLDYAPAPEVRDAEVFQEICRRLTQRGGTKNLLVIDNTGAVLTRFINQLPKRPNWHILTTSRHDIDGFDTYPLPILPKKEAEILFEKHYGKPIDDYAALENTLNEIDYLTVALELLAKTAKASHWSLQTLWEKVEASSVGFADPVEVKSGRTNEAKTIAAHIIERFVLQELTPEQRQYLLAFAVLPSVRIPFADIHDWLQIDAAQKTPFLNATNVLVEKGWLQPSENTEGSAFYCHPIIQFAVKAQMKPDVENCGVLIRTFVDLLKVDTDKGEHGVFKQELLPYGESIFEAVYKKDSEWTTEDWDFAILASRLDYIHQDLGFFDKSLEYSLVYVFIFEKILEPNDADLATAYSNHAETYGELGNNEKGLDYHLKALTIREAVLDIQHPDLAISYNNIAETYGGLGENEKGLEYHLKALAIREAVLDKQHPSLANSYNNIAETYGKLGDNEKRLEYHLKALAIREVVLGKQHPNLGASYNNIAVTYYDFKDFKKAKTYIDKAVTIQQAVLPKTHPSSLGSLKWQEEITAALRAAERGK